MTPLYRPPGLNLPDYARHPDLVPADTPPAEGVFLSAAPEGIALAKAGEKGVVRADFAGGQARHRREHGGGELLSKAVRASARPQVWDATGGLGRDSFVLACLGLDVQIFERHPAVFCLLADGVRRALDDAGAAAAAAARLRLHQGDAAQLMPQLAAQHGRPEVVYLDPMYPDRQKSAAVKKEMAYFHELVGTAQDETALLAAAMAVAAKRVVVKRPRLGAFLCGRKPDYHYTGKSTRFDVYVPAAVSGSLNLQADI